MDRDYVIQRYLTGKITPEERKWLLDNLLTFYNEVLILLATREKTRKGEGGQVE